MEPVVVRSGRRGRKRKQDVQNGLDDRQAKKQVVETRSKAYVGRYAKKEFKGSGVFLGKIVSYDTGLYRVEYEDGDCEDLDSAELRQFLIEDADLDDGLILRRKNLDELIANRNWKAKVVVEKNIQAPVDAVDKIEAPTLSELSNECANEGDAVQVDDDADSSSDSCEHAQYQDFSPEADTLVVPPPHLPPSSGNIGVQEEFVSHLFSVYGFLRSFSIRLFLSPFELDDFVGSLNCPASNTLLDAIHVALMRVMKRHLEMLSSNGSELASKCLRFNDWSLLDTLTWPVYLVQYLMIMGYTNGPDWKGFYVDALEKDYYTLSAGRKLLILQMLCDDVLESDELRAEIDMRQEAEVGTDSDAVATVAAENGPRRVHPRYSKTSACKNEEAMGIIADHGAKCSCSSTSLDVKGREVNADDIVDDGNGDECRLCGIGGTLLCCDGCPSAYHHRCIGVSKMSIPGGAWYCPECTINKVKPPITRGTYLRGAEVFGIDSYGQVFLGTCDHLLVLKFSIRSEPHLKYYSQRDIPKVLQALYSSMQHLALYSEICKRILQYWDIQKDLLRILETVEMQKQSANLDTTVSCLENSSKEPGSNKNLLGIMTQTENPSEQRSSDTLTKQVSCFKNTELLEQVKVDWTVSSSSVIQQADSADLTQQSLSVKSSLTEFAMSTSGNSSVSYGGHSRGMCGGNTCSQSRESNVVVTGGGYRNSSDEYLYMGSNFKPQAYINAYTHGDFAASAATGLAVLSSEENQVSESHASDNRRKVSANYSLQIKAFSSVAARFFWPNFEKKLVEVPRERCGWCLSCEASVSSKRGCLLNAAASNATKGAMKILACLRPVKTREGNLSAIASYIMLMEESLHGLTGGPFWNPTYRKLWRERVEQATTCGAIKPLLLDLEENIHAVALSGDWVKLVDDWSVGSPASQNGTFAAASTQKRGPSGRRGRKPAAISEVASDDFLDNLGDFNWWRGGILSKLILHRGILPRSVVKKAAHQGGCRKIPGIYYAEGSEIPKRSRQCFWRGAVEMSKNVSQLALQVRYLDLHIRWSDLVRPEQNLQEGKGPETEASAFRNASVCDKKIAADNIIYGVAFGNQKHLPSRVMKNMIEIEQTQDGKEKYWFSELRIPLYLIKEYEENVDKVHLPLADKPVNALSKLQRQQLKASRKDIFSYLSCKRDNLVKCYCASCELDVLLGKAVKCSLCEGFIHEHCTIKSMSHRNGIVGSLITCKKCSLPKTLPQRETINGSPTSPLLLQGVAFQNALTINKGTKLKSFNQPQKFVKHVESSSEMKSATHSSALVPKDRRKLCSWGLIWKKKNTDDNGIDFRLNNILLKGNSGGSWARPVCVLCQRPYNSDLMYIHCNTCEKWYHAEALELEESKIFNLVGFKCCKCRRIRSPVCPYLDPESKKTLEAKKPRARILKAGNSEVEPDNGTIYEQPKDLESSPPMLPANEEVAEDDPLLFSLSMVEEFAEQNSETDFEWNTVAATPCTAPQKLPVRRHMKNEMNVDEISTSNLPQVELSTPIERNNLLNPAEESLSPHMDWDVSKNESDDGVLDYDGLNYEDMEFEPQTYFSFTELLASDDGRQVDEVNTFREGFQDQFGAGINNQQEPSISVEYGSDIVPCRICSRTEPSADLSCQICGICIHSHCSPWVEPSSSMEGNWRCGTCREWQ
ncbi:DDT domain-containing protein PTM-like [Diospyros lotus]|uniref:DDT domain-containing protein PTM-like n=1 Tax=Diospyros lotus TaxID=55363 RepID=UPI00224DE762|nr:DDT domain-containing protein PTM-like [Diospyros lotus]